MTRSSAKAALWRLWASKRVLLRGAAVGLIYHRIASLECDPELLGVSPERFAQQVSVLSRDFNLVPAAELFALLESGRRIPKRTVCITFDDGYADALSAAYPILREHGAPGTLFVSSGYLDAPHEFWWDEIAHLCLSAHELPAQLDIAVQGAERFQADLGPVASYPAHVAGQYAAWNVTEPPPTGRQQLYLDLSAYIKRLTPELRLAALGSLREQTGIAPQRRATHRSMDSAEVVEIARDGLLEIGGHTVDHQMLSVCSADEQRSQIQADKAALERLTGRELRSFSYPHGGWDDFGDEAASIVQSVGYAGAFTTRSDVTTPWTDRFRVPRFLPRQMAAEELADTLTSWFSGNR